MYRQASLPKGACPRCFTELRPLALGAFVAQGCARCGGIFADNRLSQRITTVVDRAVLASSFLHASGKRAQPLDLHGPSLACPECARGMQVNYVQSANVRIDACADHGTFFDAHELEAVTRAFRRKRNQMHVPSADPKPRAPAMGAQALPTFEEDETLDDTILNEGAGVRAWRLLSSLFRG